jgi:phage terminase large subunit
MLAQLRATGTATPEFRGAALDLMASDWHETMIAGPAETGKTFAGLWKLDRLLRTTPGAQAVLVRKVRDTLFSTVLQTFTRKILPVAGAPPHAYGGERPQWFDYPNGARLWLAGIDDPGKALSSERDYIYVNQAEELSHDDWSVLTTRCTGRAGNTPHPQIFGDCNPGPPHHWIKNRATLRVLESRHEDNPTLWDGHSWTEQGKRTLAVLDALPGVRRDRLRYGRWVSAEGVVFEVDARVHVLSRAELVRRNILTAEGKPGKAVRHVIAGVDWGYTAPGCLGVWLIDGDGRMYLVREWYRAEQLISWWVERGKRAKAEFGVTTFVCDPARPEFVADFRRAGLAAVEAENERAPGIQAVQSRLMAVGDQMPRLFFAADALVEPDPDLLAARQPTSTLQECDSLVWAPENKAGKLPKEGTTLGADHGADAMRYAVAWADRLGRGVRPGLVPRSETNVVSTMPADVFRNGD